MSTQQPNRSGPWLFRQLPLKAKVLFFSAVFCLFAPLGLLLVSSVAQERDLLPMVIALFAAGLVAVFWALTGTISRWFLIPAILMNVVFGSMMSGNIPMGGKFERAIPFSTAGAVWTGVFAILMIGSYILFILFITGDAKQRLRMQTELELAQQIHSSLVPAVDLNINGFDLYGTSVPSSEMGGDLLDVVRRDDEVDVFLADVSGHGIKAGIIMAMVKSALRMQIRSTKEARLGELFEGLNDVLFDTTEPAMFATIAAIRLNTTTRSLEFALAGHLPILRWKRDGGLIEELSNDSLPLGIVAGERVCSRQTTLAPGDVLIMLTDGLIESMGPNGKPIGQLPVNLAIKGHAAKSARELHDAILNAVKERGRAVDDQTLIVIRAA